VKTLISYADANDPLWKRITIHGIEKMTGKPELQRLYDEARSTPVPIRHFWELALRLLDIRLHYDTSKIASIPQTGPLVIIANHPFGVVDGIGICYLAGKIRPHFRILTNSVLCQDAELNQFMLPIDFAETREAARINIETKRLAVETLQQDGAVVIFPGGGVSTSQSWFGPAEDLEWKRFTAKLVQTAQATVLPIYFHGQNSRLFQIVSQFSLTLRLALLLREVKNKMGLTIDVTIGNPIPFQAMAHLKNRQKLLDWLRETTYGLAESTEENL